MTILFMHVLKLLIDFIYVLFCHFYLVARPPHTVQTEKVKKTDEKSTRSTKTPKLKDLIDAEFEKELQKFIESKQQLQIGDYVMARMKGFPPWPGRVENFSSNSKMVACYFFGKHNCGPVGSKNIIPFALANETARLVCLRPPNAYIKAVKEIEVKSGVPRELSCLNALKSIK